jgi:hypothetical protein
MHVKVLPRKIALAPGPMKMEQTEFSETLAFKLQTPGNNSEESIRHSKHGESLKSRIFILTYE